MRCPPAIGHRKRNLQTIKTTSKKMNLHKLLRTLSMLTAALLTGAASMTASPPVVMKLLVIAWDNNDISYQSLTHDLGQIGVPFQTVFVNNLTPDESGNRLSGLTLVDPATGNGMYQGIIQTDSSFTVCTTACSSLLSATDLSKLDTYAVQYSVRMVCYYGWPDQAWGLQTGDYGASYTSTNPLNVTLTPAGSAIFSYLSASATIPFEGQHGYGLWAYKALPIAAANETTTPILVSGDYTVGVTHTTADGRETLALTMDNYPGFLHSEALSYGVINWVTKGVFLGSRRVYLNPEIDDMLLGNRLYAPTLPQCPNDISCPTYYATGADVEGLAAWQASLQATPQFQSFHNTFAFNGIGTTWFAPTDPVYAAIKDVGSNFTWMSHTWGHPNLDCYSTDADGNCVPATVDQSLSELNQNIAAASSLGITLDSVDMVTPFNGGLTNPAFLQAAAQVGIQNIVYNGDPPSTQNGLVNPFVSSIFQFTRRVPDLFDDVSTPQTGVAGSWPDEFNALYGPAGTSPTQSTNLTYSQILDVESDGLLLHNMLTYEPYPLAFHIDNMAMYDGTHSMMSDLVDEAIAKYTSIFSLPVITNDMHDIATILKTRASFDASGVVGVYTPGVNVVLTTNNAATIPVTGACSQTTCGTYGGQMQDSVAMAPNSTVTLSVQNGGGVTQ
jgi:hypothetical protein